jgi:hypothetical protein
MALFLLNKIGYWPPVKQRADGASTVGVPEQDLLHLPLVHEVCSAHPFPEYYPFTPNEAALRRIIPNNPERSARRASEVS